MAKEKEAVVETEVVTPEVEPQEEVISKKVYDKKVAELNKKLKEKMSEEEKRDQEYQEKLEELETLRLKDAQNTLITGLVDHGIDKKEADKISNAIITGDFEAIAKSFGETFNSMKETLNKEIEKVKLESTERPSSEAGDAPKTMTKEEFSKLSLEEKQKIFDTDNETFVSLTKEG